MDFDWASWLVGMHETWGRVGKVVWKHGHCSGNRDVQQVPEETGYSQSRQPEVPPPPPQVWDETSENLLHVLFFDNPPPYLLISGLFPQGCGGQAVRALSVQTSLRSRSS